MANPPFPVTPLPSKPEATTGVSTLVGVDSDGKIVQSAPYTINATDRGVKASNSRAENSARIQEIWDELEAEDLGGKVRFPRGLLQVDPGNPIIIPKASGKYFEMEGEGSATIFDIGSSTTDYAFYNGDVSTGPGLGVTVRNMTFKGPSTTTGVAWKLDHGNAARFSGCTFTNMRTACLMNASYSVEFSGGMFENIGLYCIQSATHCHHLVVNRMNVYNAGIGTGTGRFLQIDAGPTQTDNIVIRDNDFEGCRQILYTVEGTSSMIIEGNYIEFTSTDAFAFGTGAYGLAMNNNWFSLGGTFSFHSWLSGEFKRNRLYNQVVAFDADCGDVDVADNWVTGTSTLTTTALWKNITTFLNSATADGTSVPQYQKKNGIVYCRGQVNNLPGTGAAVCQLPAGYTPQTNLIVPAVRADLSAAAMTIATDGRIIPTGGAATNVRLDGIRFPCAN